MNRRRTFRCSLDTALCSRLIRQLVMTGHAEPCAIRVAVVVDYRYPPTVLLR